MCVVRLSTSSAAGTVSVLITVAAPQPHVERVAQGVADQVAGHHDGTRQPPTG